MRLPWTPSNVETEVEAMDVALILVPYHLGEERVGMGLGPERLLDAGAVQELNSHGYSVYMEMVFPQSAGARDQLAAVVEINIQIADSVGAALRRGRFPLVLTGNCNACLGTLAGMDARPAGAIWFDAHGDFNTPETSPSGFLDGMSLAMATGLCHQPALSELGGSPISSAHLIHIGGRDFDIGERERLERHGAHVVTAEEVNEIGLTRAFRAPLSALKSQVEDVYLHVDLDVVDASEARANEFASTGGLSVMEVERAIRMVGETLIVRAAALSAFDPAYDEDGRAVAAALRLMLAVANVASGPAAS